MIGAISSALSGLNAASQKLTQSANNIARAGAEASNALNNDDAVRGNAPLDAAILPQTDLTSEIVNLNLAEVAYKANLATLNAAQEQADSLLDILDTDD